MIKEWFFGTLLVIVLSCKYGNWDSASLDKRAHDCSISFGHFR